MEQDSRSKDSMAASMEAQGQAPTTASQEVVDEALKLAKATCIPLCVAAQSGIIHAVQNATGTATLHTGIPQHSRSFRKLNTEGFHSAAGGLGEGSAQNMQVWFLLTLGILSWSA